jgi:hypothetical protein
LILKHRLFVVFVYFETRAKSSGTNPAHKQFVGRFLYALPTRLSVNEMADVLQIWRSIVTEAVREAILELPLVNELA